MLEIDETADDDEQSDDAKAIALPAKHALVCVRPPFLLRTQKAMQQKLLGVEDDEAGEVVYEVSYCLQSDHCGESVGGEGMQDLGKGEEDDDDDDEEHERKVRVLRRAVEASRRRRMEKFRAGGGVFVTDD